MPPRFAVVEDTFGMDYLDLGFLCLLAAFVLASWLNFTLAELGLARPLVVLTLVGAGVVVFGGVIGRRVWRFPSLSVVAGLVLSLSIGALLFFPPDEWILGALDAGSYMNAGATIARSGSIVLLDPDLTLLNPALRQALFPFPASRLPGFYLTTGDFSGLLLRGFVNSPNHVVPHGFHLFPTVLSFGFALGGVRAETLVPPLLAEAGLAAFYLLARRMFGTGVSSVGTVLLALSPGEVWFARYPTAEGLSQVLLFGGFLALILFLSSSVRWLGVVAGLSLGAAHLAKIETFPLPLLIAAYVAYLAMVNQFDRRWFWFLCPYGIILGQAIVHALYVSTWYTVTSFEKIVTSRQMYAVSAVLLGCLLLAIALVVFPAARNAACRLLTAPVWKAPAGWVISTATGFLAFYAYYVRPLSVPVPPISPVSLGQWSVSNDALSLVRLGWYVTPIGVLLGTLGWMLIGHRERNRVTTLPLLVIAVDTCVYLMHMYITPIHYWAARRWITLVIPGFFLAMAYVLIRLVPRSRARLIDAVVPCGLAVALIIGLYQADIPLLGYVEYRGAIEQLGALATSFPADAVLLFPDGDAGQRLSVPLQYIFERRAYDVLLDPRVEAAAGSAAQGWLNQGRPVYWVTTADLPDPSAIGLRGVIVSRQRLSLPEKIATLDRPPGADGVFQQDLIVWKLAP